MLIDSLSKLIHERCTDEGMLLQALIEALWLGNTLIVPGNEGETDSILYKIGEHICLVSFGDETAAENYLRQVTRMGVAPEMREETVETLLTRIEHEDYKLFIEVADERRTILPRAMTLNALDITRRITGGLLPSEDMPLIRLHQSSFGNGEAARTAERCGCFHCGAVFDGAQIVDFVDERNGLQTARCPRCSVDAVLAGTDDAALLERMLTRFFGEKPSATLEARAKYYETMKRRCQMYPDGDVPPSVPVERLVRLRRELTGGK